MFAEMVESLVPQDINIFNGFNIVFALFSGEF